MGGAAAILRHRKWAHSYDAEELVKRYVSTEERDRIMPLLGGAEEYVAKATAALKDMIDDYSEELAADVVDEMDKDGVDWAPTAPMDWTISEIAVMKEHLARPPLPRVATGVLGLEKQPTYDGFDSDDERGETGSVARSHASSSQASLLMKQQAALVKGGLPSVSSAMPGKPSSAVLNRLGGIAGSSGSGALSGAALYALKTSCRFLKSNVPAQYLCASVGHVEQSVGMHLAGHGIDKQTLTRYLDEQISPVHVAAELGHHEIVNILVEECGCDLNAVDKCQRTVLHYACKRGKLATVKVLVGDHGADVDATDEDGLTPLTYAVIGGYLSVTKYLVELEEQGTDTWINRLKQVDQRVQGSLLHWSTLSGKLPIVQYLVSHCGFSLEQKTKVDQVTPVFWAAFAGSMQVLEYLISSGSNVKRRDANLQNIMHYAAASGQLDKIYYLSKAVNVPLADKDDNTDRPQDIACSAVCTEYIRHLKKRMKYGAFAL